MKRLRIVSAVVVLGIVCRAQANAQPTYSIDQQGPTIGLIDAGGSGLITGGDILTPTPLAGPPPPPATVIPAGAVGLGLVPTALGFTEVDALSYGIDDLIVGDSNPDAPSFFYFSPDEFAVGFPGPPPLPPNVTTEGPGLAGVGPGEASADVYVYPFGPFPGVAAPPPPVPPGVVIGNTGVFDGNGGISPFVSPTLNLSEPNPPSPGTFMGPDQGDNLDALDVDTPIETIAGAFYSLDSSFPDPLEVPAGAAGPPNTGTALANVFVGGDVLFSPLPGGPPALYASALSLGLDLLGTDSDDLDALILNDTTDGTPGTYTPTAG